jgi:hypothetical protein
MDWIVWHPGCTSLLPSRTTDNRKEKREETTAMFKTTITALASIVIVSFALTGCTASADDESDGSEGASALERGRAAGDTSASATDDSRREADTRRDDNLPNLRRHHAARIQAARRAAAAADDDRRTPDRDGDDRGDADRTPDRDGDRPAIVTRRNTDDTRR